MEDNILYGDLSNTETEIIDEIFLNLIENEKISDEKLFYMMRTRIYLHLTMLKI